jgi:uncharacterized membrane protein
MQLKFNRRKSAGEYIGMKLIKLFILIVFFVLVVFLLDKVNFPSPEKKIKTDVTNEIIKLK